MTTETEYNKVHANIFIIINYIIALVTAIIVIIFFIGTVISKSTHRYLKTVHIQFFISALFSCGYHFLYIKEYRCRGILALEIFTTFPIVAQLTFMILCTYLIFKDQFETGRTRIYLILSILFNWIPAFMFEASLKSGTFGRYKFFCYFDREKSLFTALWIVTLVFQFYFYLIILLIHRKFREIKSNFPEETNLVSKIHRKMCIQFGFGVFYSCVMWIFIFTKGWFGQGLYYFIGIFYHLSVPVLCFVFIWSSNLRKSISQIPYFKWLAERQNSSEENNEIALM